MRVFHRIAVDPAIMNGQACVRGTRLTVRRVLDLLVTYPDRGELLQEFPELDGEAIDQALGFAAASLADETVELRLAS